MGGPWEDFAKAPAQGDIQAEDGPWTDFQAPTVTQPTKEPKGEQVYDQPIGPEQASAVDRFKERVQDPKRWQAIIKGEGPYAQKVVQGDVPLVMPGGAVPKLTKAAVALAEGKGIGYMLGRTALSAGQGAVMSGMDSKEGESPSEKYDRTLKGAKLSGGIQLAAETIPVLGKFAKFTGTKAASALTGEPEQVIKTYAGQTDDVNKIIKRSGGDTAGAYDDLRQKLSKGLENAKLRLNQSISNTLKKNPGATTHSVDDVLRELEKSKEGINPTLFPDAIEQIDDLAAKIRKVAEEGGGKVNAQGLNDITQFLQEAGESAYNKGGQTFIRAKESAKAAKGAAAVSRVARNEASPELAGSYAELQKIRAATKNANKNLIAPERSDSALNAVGAGQNERNEKVVQVLGKVAGFDALGEAQRIAAARSFASPAWFPTGSTGKTAGRLILGAGTGYAIDGEKGAMVGAGLTSPAMLKLGINAANVASKYTPNIARAIRQNPVAAQTGVQLAAKHIRSQDAKEPEQEVTTPVLGEKPKSGPDRWAQAGLEKLGVKDSALSQKLLKSKEGKRLLIEASDLKPGSKAMQRIKNEIQKGWVNNESNSGPSSEISRRERRPSSRR